MVIEQEEIVGRCVQIDYLILGTHFRSQADLNAAYGGVQHWQYRTSKLVPTHYDPLLKPTRSVRSPCKRPTLSRLHNFITVNGSISMRPPENVL